GELVAVFPAEIYQSIAAFSEDTREGAADADGLHDEWKIGDDGGIGIPGASQLVIGFMGAVQGNADIGDLGCVDFGGIAFQQKSIGLEGYSSEVQVGGSPEHVEEVLPEERLSTGIVEQTYSILMKLVDHFNGLVDFDGIGRIGFPIVANLAFHLAALRELDAREFRDEALGQGGRGTGHAADRDSRVISYPQDSPSVLFFPKRYQLSLLY